MDKKEKASLLAVIILFAVVNILMYFGGMTTKDLSFSHPNSCWYSCWCGCKDVSRHEKHDHFGGAHGVWFVNGMCNTTHGNFFNSLKPKLVELCGSQMVANTATMTTKIGFGGVMVLTLVFDLMIYLACIFVLIALKILLPVFIIGFLFFFLPFRLLCKLSHAIITGGEKCRTMWEALHENRSEECKEFSKENKDIQIKKEVVDRKYEC